MATTTKRTSSSKRTMTAADYYLYAPLGAGDLLLEKGRELSRRAWARALQQRARLLASSRQLASRGEKLVASARATAIRAAKKVR
jgi:hypothetical protein